MGVLYLICWRRNYPHDGGTRPTEHRVEGLLSVTWEKQVEQTTQYIGRGRGSVHREKRVLEKTRYHITLVFYHLIR